MTWLVRGEAAGRAAHVASKTTTLQRCLVSDGIGAMWRAGSPPGTCAAVQRRRNKACAVPAARGGRILVCHGREGLAA